MGGDAKRGDLAVKHDIDFEERFKKLVANVKRNLPTFKEGAWTAFFSFTTTMGVGLYCEKIIRNVCIDCCIPQSSPQSQFLSRCGGYKPLVESFLTRGPFEKGHNLALMWACNTSISFVMKAIRGKEDLQTIMVSGFGYGVVISLVTGMRGPSVLSVGATCAILNVGMRKAGIKPIPFPKPVY